MRRGMIGASFTGVTFDTGSGAPSGTNSPSWTVNTDAAAATNEDPFIELKGGDGTNLVDWRATLETTSERVEFRTRRDGVEIATALHIGTPGIGSTQSVNQDLVLNSGNGVTARVGGMRSDTTGAVTISGPTGIGFGIGAHPATAVFEINGGSQLVPKGSGGNPATPRLCTGLNDSNTGLYGDGNDIFGLTTGGVGEERRNRTVATSDATVTTIDTIALTDETLYLIETRFYGRDQAGTVVEYFGGVRRGIFHRDAAGAAAQLGSTQVIGTDIESDAGLDATFAVSGNNVLAQVTGKAATAIRWHSHTIVMPVSTT